MPSELECLQLVHGLLVDVNDGAALDSDQLYSHLERAQAGRPDHGCVIRVSHPFRDDPVTKETRYPFTKW